MTDILKDREIATQTTHEDVVRAAADQVLTRDIPWDGYQKANMITDKELELIRKFDKKSEETKRSLLAKEGDAYAELFLELLLKLNKEETFQYLLTLIDGVLSENSANVKLFLNLSTKKPAFPYDPFIRILTRSTSDWYTNAKASNVLANLMSATNGEVSEQNVKFMCQWLRTQLRSNEEKDVANAVSALMKFLRRDDFRPQFAAEDGLLFLGSLLKGKNRSYQLTYQTVYCLWLITYNKTIVNQISSTKVIQYIIDVLKAIQKEKIVRMALATLVNLLGSAQNNEQMLDAGIQKPLDIMSNKQWGDEDIVQDLKTLRESLESNIQELSSFDVYRREVVSGNLEWSPVHKSEKFWKENSHRLEEENYKLLNILKGYITSEAPNPLTTSVACFDLGEFARIHPRGRSILQQLNIKIPLMQLMEDKDPEVKKQALAAVQKLMVFNWEYLSMA